MESGSKIYTSYRGLGLVSNHIPLVITYIKRKKENLIFTAVGNAFHTYSDKKLSLKNVGNPHTSPITCMTCDNFHVYTADKNAIYAWRRTTELTHTYRNHMDDIHLIMPFGSHLISVDKKNSLHIWDIKSEEKFLEIEFSPQFWISSIFHPATYINKILLGSKQGKLQLWNINTNKLIYTFSGWNSEVTVLEQAPAEDVAAIGLSNGQIYLHNLKFDETIMKFEQDWGAVTAISFRTDGVPVMVSGSMLGHIAVWDLQSRCLSSQIWQAHKKAVTGLKCLPNEPRMVTSSADNTIKMWIFDLPDGGARQLNVRGGHSAPPLMARFRGFLGNTILTAGEDSTLRVFSTVNDSLNKSLGEASYNKKAAYRDKSRRGQLRMPPIIAFTSEGTHKNPWDSIACIHQNLPTVTTWSFDRQTMGEHKLKHERFKKSELKDSAATCVELTVCCNYIIIGYDSGHLDKYNIQSGIYRGSFKDDDVAHNDSVRGVASDGLNQVVVSGDQQGILKWWKFKTMEKITQLKLNFGISVLQLMRDSGLLALGLEDWSLQIVDIDTRTVIRRISGHTNQITDITFSPNSKWIVSASLDRSLRTWDLPSSTCIDWFNLPVAASSICMSPTGEFLATIHAGHLGIYLWANRTCFQHVSLTPLPENFVPSVIPLPTVGVDHSEMHLIEDAEPIEEEMEMEIEEEYVSPEQISRELITLALLPTSRWLNLLHIDTIKKRNRPVEPPKAPKSAPFFIPTVPGLDFKFGVDPSTTDGKDQHQQSKVKNVSTFEALTPFGEKLKQKSFEEAMEMLMKMGPSSIDVEIRGLDPEIGGTEEILLNFLRMVKFSLDKRKYFEVTQGYLSLFLKIHTEFCIQNEEAQEICQKLLNSQQVAWHGIKNTLNQSLSLISYFKNAAVINY